MPFSLTCPSCRSKIKAPEQVVGRTIKCPRCQAALTVSAPRQQAAVGQQVSNRLMPAAVGSATGRSQAGTYPPARERNGNAEADATQVPAGKKRGGGKIVLVVLLLLGAGFFLFCLVPSGVGVWYFFVHKSDKAATNETAAASTAPAPIAPPLVDSHEKVLLDEMTLIKDMTALLKPVRDQGSADQARAKCKEFGPRVHSLKTRSDTLGTATAAEKQQLQAKHQQTCTQTVLSLSTELTRLLAVPGGQLVIKELHQQVKEAPDLDVLVGMFDQQNFKVPGPKR